MVLIMFLRGTLNSWLKPSVYLSLLSAETIAHLPDFRLTLSCELDLGHLPFVRLLLTRD